MRADTPAFAAKNNARQKSPRFVARIEYDVDTIALTSHAGISGVLAGTILEGVLLEPTVTSQRLKPDDAVAEIGSASFTLVDVGSQFTTEIRERLLDGAGLRGRQIEFYVGYDGLTFDEFMLVATQIVSSVSFSQGVYQIACLDIQRALRTEVFEPKLTTLAAAVAVDATVITLTSTTGFELVNHGPSFTDAPNTAVLYVKIKNEIIRATGIAGNQLTGCTRGVLGTVAAAYPVDTSVPAERREKVSEYIYLELPAAKLALAVLTGTVRGNMLSTFGGFETDSNADGLSDQWQNYSNTNTYSRPAGLLGAASQRFQGNGGSSPRLTTSFGVFVPAGMQFTVSAYFLATAGVGLLLGAKGYNAVAGSETHSYTNTTLVATGAWQRVSATYTSAAAGQYIRPSLGLSGSPASGTAVQIDGVQVEVGGTATSYTTTIGGPLPSHWHLGVSESLVRISDFNAIGPDLWDINDDTKGLILRFEGLTRTDGKRFLEKEVYLVAACFSPVYADGTLGLRRMSRVREDAATVMTLTAGNSTQVGDLTHDMRALHNVFVVNWSWNGSEFRRTSSYVDAASAAKHEDAETVTLNFKGLHGSRHTDGVIIGILGMLRDRYAGPPLRLSLSLRHSVNMIEVGDIVRVRHANVRDFSAPSGKPTTLDRAFEVQHVSVDHRSGEVQVELFGSTADPIVTSPTAPLGAVSSLPDAYYNSEGTQLSSVPGVVIGSNVMTAAPASPISGNAVLTASGAILYHLGDLTIAAGVDLKIAANVQLRVRGFLQVNGSINGIAGGLPGVADDSRVLFALVPTGISFFEAFYETIPGNPGHVGSTRGYDGATGMRLSAAAPTFWYDTRPAASAPSRNSVAPRLLLSVAGSVLNGLPSDLRGAGGPPGGRAQYYAETGGLIAGFIPGGTGGSGGAGLAIICRGMAFGANGFIDLSGADTAAPGTGLTDAGFTIRPGAGGPGGPGTLLVLLDGSGLSVPDFGTNKFRGKVGTATFTATPLPQQLYNVPGQTDGLTSPATGFREPEFTTINGADLSGAALTVQHIPGVEIVTPDQDSGIPAPTTLTTESAEQQINVSMGVLSGALLTVPGGIDAGELYMSSSNDRANATKVFEGLATVIPVRVPDGVTRYFWGRYRDGSLRSEWFPVSATAGIVGTSVGGLICRGNCEGFNTGIRKNGGASAWDSDAYSPETFANGIFVSFVPQQTDKALAIGLNADPETDSDITSLDYAWRLLSTGVAQIIEAGSTITSVSYPYTTASTFEVRYDGTAVRFYLAGAMVRAFFVGARSYFVDSSFFHASGAVRSLKYGPLSTIPEAPWIVRGFCSVNGNTIVKVGGGALTNDSDAYSQHVHADGCALTFQAGQTTSTIHVGLNSDPASSLLAANIDYGWSIVGNGTAAIIESGAFPISFTAYTINTVFQVKFDGQQIVYLRDGVVVRTVALPGGRLFFAHASFTHPGTIVNVGFVPLTQAASIPWILRGFAAATATTARKAGGPAATWDTDVYSSAGYRGGCAIAFIPDSTTKGLMVGLDDSPAGGTNFTTMDFGVFCSDTLQRVQLYESGTMILDLGTAQYDATTHFAITYDGHVVRYLRNGVVVREKYSPGRTLYGRAALRDPAAAVRALEFTPLTDATPVPFLTRSTQIILGPTSARKILSGTSAWDADFISVSGYTECHLQFKPTQVNGALMVGLNSDPYTDSTYTGIDAAWYVRTDGLLEIYESNVATTGFGAYTSKTQLGITYDGTNVRYYKDGVLQRTTAMAGLTMFADASLFTPGAGVNGMTFGPGSVLSVADTADIAPFAATQVMAFTLLPPSTTGPSCPVGTTSFNSNCGFTGYSSLIAVEVEAQCSFRVLVREILSAPVTAAFTVRAWLEEVVNGAGVTATVPAFEKTTTAVENAAMVSRFTYAGHATDLRQVRFICRLETDGTQHLQANVTNVHMRTTLVKR